MTKIKCDDCLKLFPVLEIEELALTKEKLCTECYAARKKLNQVDNPSPMP